MTAEEKLTMAVTPQVLEDYHNQKVAPFLNPAIQYFGKNNVYSSDEKVVGQWTDKRPLYQKVIEKNGNFNGPVYDYDLGLIPGYDSTWRIKIMQGYIMINNSGTSFVAEACYSHPKSSEQAIGYYVTNGHIFLNMGSNASGTNLSFVVLYTKTTDSPISVPLGDPNEYTTDERWVGMWMGQPLYQKTVDCGALPNHTDKRINHNISNLGRVVEVSGHAYNSSTGISLPLPFTSTNINFIVEVNVQPTQIYIISMDESGAITSYGSSYVTLRYTKTS